MAKGRRKKDPTPVITEINNEEVTQAVEYNDIVEYCARTNTTTFNLLKAIEEASEFSEVLIKLQTKSAKNPKRPNEEEAVKEFGDFMYRGFIALMTLFPDQTFEQIDERVQAHMEYKLSKLEEYRQNHKYDGGL